MNSDVRHAFCKCNRVRHAVKFSGSEASWSKYRRLRNIAVSTEWRAKHNYFSSLCLDNDNLSGRLTIAYLKQLLKSPPLCQMVLKVPHPTKKKQSCSTSTSLPVLPVPQFLLITKPTLPPSPLPLHHHLQSHLLHE